MSISESLLLNIKKDLHFKENNSQRDQINKSPNFPSHLLSSTFFSHFCWDRKKNHTMLYLYFSLQDCNLRNSFKLYAILVWIFGIVHIHTNIQSWFVWVAITKVPQRDGNKQLYLSLFLRPGSPGLRHWQIWCPVWAF